MGALHDSRKVIGFEKTLVHITVSTLISRMTSACVLITEMRISSTSQQSGISLHGEHLAHCLIQQKQCQCYYGCSAPNTSVRL